MKNETYYKVTYDFDKVLSNFTTMRGGWSSLFRYENTQKQANETHNFDKKYNNINSNVSVVTIDMEIYEQFSDILMQVSLQDDSNLGVCKRTRPWLHHSVKCKSWEKYKWFSATDIAKLLQRRRVQITPEVATECLHYAIFAFCAWNVRDGELVARFLECKPDYDDDYC